MSTLNIIWVLAIVVAIAVSRVASDGDNTWTVQATSLLDCQAKCQAAENPFCGHYDYASDGSGTCTLTPDIPPTTVLPPINGQGPAPTVITGSTPTSSWLTSKCTTSGNGIFQIKGTASGLCMAVEMMSKVAGANIKDWYCDNLPRSQWTIIPPSSTGKGFQIKNINSGLCISIAGGSTALVTSLVQWECTDLPLQQWNILETSANDAKNVMLQSVLGDLCIGVADASVQPVAQLVTWHCDGVTRSQWSQVC